MRRQSPSLLTERATPAALWPCTKCHKEHSKWCKGWIEGQTGKLRKGLAARSPTWTLAERARIVSAILTLLAIHLIGPNQVGTSSFVSAVRCGRCTARWGPDVPTHRKAAYV